MPLVSAYLRDSGGEAQELSIIQQEQRIREWCSENGYQLRTLFKDEARPGSSTVGRTAFQEMILYLVEGSAVEKILIVWSFSRFARDLNDAMFYKAMLRRQGIEIISITDDLPDDPKFSTLIEFITDWKNDQFRIDLSKDVKRGLQHVLREHGARAGTPPRGFTRETFTVGEHRSGKPHTVSRWIPDPELWDTCARAWRMRLNGESIKKIHRETGLFSAQSSYSTFFRNPIYKGALVYGEIFEEGYYPAMVSPEDWDQVQRESIKFRHINDPRKQAQRKNSSYLLSGLCYCGECGAPMNGKTVSFSTKQNHPYRYYECSRKQRTAGVDCDMQAIRAEAVEGAVTSALMEVLQSPQVLVDMITQSNTEDLEDREERETNLKREIKSLRQKIDSTADLVVTTGSSSLAKRLIEMEENERRLRAELSSLQHTGSNLDITNEELMIVLQELGKRLLDLPRQELRAILNNLIFRVLVGKDKKNLTGNIVLTAPQTAANNGGVVLCADDESPWRHYKNKGTE